jgi:hypothetical protein
MTEVRRARRSDFIRVVTNGCDVCKPDNITIIPRYRIHAVTIVGGNGMSFGFATPM